MQQQEVIKQAHEMKSVEQTTCCIVGGGPAGVILALQVNELVEENGVVCGVRYHGQDGWHEIRAALTVGADGRFSRLRRLAGFEPIQTASPLDVLWFRLPIKRSRAAVNP